MLTLWPALAGGAPPKVADLVRGELIADTDAIVPGKAFRLGVHLRMAPRWHVYWKHPGETGLPTTVKLTLPDGFAAGEVKYPVPRRFVQPGDIVGFGYADEVMLLIDVTPPADVSPRAVAIEANVSYLVCEQVCLPGDLSLKIDLPVKTSGDDDAATPRPAAEDHAELFSQWLARLPAAVTPTRVSGTLDDGDPASPAEFSATVPLEEPAQHLELFPQTPDALQTSDWSVEEGGGDAFAIVRFRAKVLKGLELKTDALPILLAYTDAQGNRKGINVEVPLRKAAPVTQP